MFTPEPWGFMIQFDEHIFADGLVQAPTRNGVIHMGLNINFLESEVRPREFTETTTVSFLRFLKLYNIGGPQNKLYTWGEITI